jgi:hypothetical protein
MTLNQALAGLAWGNVGASGTPRPSSHDLIMLPRKAHPFLFQGEKAKAAFYVTDRSSYF